MKISEISVSELQYWWTDKTRLDKATGAALYGSFKHLLIVENYMLTKGKGTIYLTCAGESKSSLLYKSE